MIVFERSWSGWVQPVLHRTRVILMSCGVAGIDCFEIFWENYGNAIENLTILFLTCSLKAFFSVTNGRVGFIQCWSNFSRTGVSDELGWYTNNFHSEFSWRVFENSRTFLVVVRWVFLSMTIARIGFMQRQFNNSLTGSSDDHPDWPFSGFSANYFNFLEKSIVFLVVR